MLRQAIVTTTFRLRQGMLLIGEPPVQPTPCPQHLMHNIIVIIIVIIIRILIIIAIILFIKMVIVGSSERLGLQCASLH